MSSRALLFDREAERYDRTRPGYPRELVDAVLGRTPRGLSVVDVGCGTGIAARLFARRGADVLGVELNPRLAGIARRHGIRTETARFEDWDAAGRTFDRVACAQAWHWLDHEVSIAKAASLLRPAGRLCLFWSVGRHEDDLADALAATYARVVPPDARLAVGYAANRASDRLPDFAEVTDALGACDGLEAPEVASFPWSRTYTRDEWLDQLPTHSDHAALAPDVRERLLAEVGETIDRLGGAFRMAFTTILVAAAAGSA